MIDVLIVFRNASKYLDACLRSLYAHTSGFSLYLFDNGSGIEAQHILRQRLAGKANAWVVRSPRNEGEVRPGNILSSMGDSPYVCHLNSDVELLPGWAEALTGHLAQHPECGVAGFEGGLLDARGVGRPAPRGVSPDYVVGWCVACRRSDWEAVGGWDRELRHSYCLDSCLALALRERGLEPHVLEPPRAVHKGGATASAVRQEMDLDACWAANHEYMRRRHAAFLAGRA